MTSRIFIDFETRSACDLKACGLDVYARHPTTDVLCVGWAEDTGGAYWSPPDTIMFDDCLRYVAHNAPFELAIWNHVLVPKYGWEPVRPEDFECSMAMAYAMGLPGSLEAAGAAVGLEAQKDMAGHRLMRQMAKPRDIAPDGSITWWEGDERLRRLGEYCCRDVESQRELYHRLLPLSDVEREVWLLDQEINNRGVQVDLPAVEAAIAAVEEETALLNARMQKLTNGMVGACSAVSQIADWLKFRGVQTPGLAKADVIALLDEVDKFPVEVRDVLNLRREAAKSSVAKLKAMSKGACDDGRMRGLFQYHGASTGRWAGRRVQLQNLPRSKMKPQVIDRVFQCLR